jgi:hypothetical protein
MVSLGSYLGRKLGTFALATASLWPHLPDHHTRHQFFSPERACLAILLVKFSGWLIRRCKVGY